MVIKPKVQATAQPQAVEKVDQFIPLLPTTRLFGVSDTAVVEFTDFECPFCKQYATTELAKVRKMNVSYFSFNFPLTNIHSQAEGAALAAICAAQQGGLNKMHDKLFASPLDPKTYNAYATEIGINTEKFEQCLTIQPTKNVLEMHKAIGKRLNIGGTPTLFIGTIEGNQIHLKRMVNWKALERELKEFGS